MAASHYHSVPLQVVELLVSTGLLAPGEAGDEGDAALAAPNPAAGVAPGSRGSLTYAEIMARGGGAVSITRAGYVFLLRDTAVQLWTFLRAYIESAASRGARPADVLAFILELGFCSAGHGYAIAGLSSTQRALLEDFESFGLVHVPAEQEALPPAHSELEALAAAQAAGVNLGESPPAVPEERMRPISQCLLYNDRPCHAAVRSRVDRGAAVGG